MNSTDVAPPSEFVPRTQAELARFVAENAAGARRPLAPVGGRTALDCGLPVDPASMPLAMHALARVVDYPARDMTVTVEAGIRIDELAELLRGERQQLPIDAPQSHRATLGGVVACNVSGSRRYGYGTLRDYVIGVTAIDGTGRTFHAGGRVVKNVAGYDLCKLVIGSLGTLAVITQLTLKLKPIPEASALMWATYDSFAEIDDVLHRLLTSAARPVILDVLNPEGAAQVAADCRRDLPCDRPALVVGVEGSPRDVAWQLDALTRELAPLGPDELFSLSEEEAAPIRAAMTEFQIGSDEPLSFQANLRPSAAMAFLQRATQAGCAVQSHAGNGIVRGHFPESAASLDKAGALVASLREAAEASQGGLIVTRCDPVWKSRLSLWGAPSSAEPLMPKLRAALDPHGVLSRGRFVS